MKSTIPTCKPTKYIDPEKPINIHYSIIIRLLLALNHVIIVVLRVE